jgi:hypothetical protein
MELSKLTDQLGEGAIVYVDDFAGTGNQFCQVRDFFAQHIIGSFPEFFLLPCICEEALYELAKRGVEALKEYIHSKEDRPLHENSTALSPRIKTRLIELCNKIDPKGGLGYKKMATMVVIYRNAPTTVPLLFRGNLGQSPYRGIFPRTTDFSA